LGAGCSGALPATIRSPGDLHKNNDTVAATMGPDPSEGSAEWPTRMLTPCLGKKGHSVGMHRRARGTLIVRTGVGVLQG
jgi:hypothetical protein